MAAKTLKLNLDSITALNSILQHLLQSYKCTLPEQYCTMAVVYELSLKIAKKTVELKSEYSLPLSQIEVFAVTWVLENTEMIGLNSFLFGVYNYVHQELDPIYQQTRLHHHASQE